MTLLDVPARTAALATIYREIPQLFAPADAPPPLSPAPNPPSQEPAEWYNEVGSDTSRLLGMDNVVDHLLVSQAIEPILIDVGSSGGSPRIWQPIRSYSTYVGFDGDTREIHHPQEAEYRHACFAHEVITCN